MVYIGWLIAFLLVTLQPSVLGMLLLLIFGSATIVLSQDHNFPKRSQALQSSWIGPVVIIAAQSFQDVLSRYAMKVCPANYVQLDIIISGVLIAAIVGWLWRGYGFVPLLALASRTGSERFRHSAIEATRNYPWHLWWLLPAVLLALSVIAAGLAAPP